MSHNLETRIARLEQSLGFLVHSMELLYEAIRRAKEKSDGA